MKFTRETVEAIAELAKLRLSEQEIARYTEQLSSILTYVEKLNEVDTSNVPLTASVLPLQNVLRQDVPATPLTPTEVVANAHQAEDNQFRVSAVLDNS
ncbi:MAG: Asp-tRNA(Asn)/Glu-tRNA(Gln) amidotransferase subunit GatC [Phototrophicaceae bacterium]